LAIPLLGRHRAVSAFEWLPFVREEGRFAAEAEARSAGLVDYRFWEIAPDGSQREAKPRAFYVPIHYMEPPSAGAIGFDVASEPARLATVEKARDTGLITASHPFTLVEDVGRDAAPAVAVYAPIFAEREYATVPQRRAGLLGFTLVVFRVAPLMDAAASKVGAT